ncbi:hypothetical protein SCLCIDRAFT_329404 [Scleroderma citrinum Foug A]|uniref:Uncharacterized protein n=1 Tax=Scleroderma citrinum Foug A TaxID=1036808 RepID=A0A0C3ANK4_9AGAM|nr:hypothetical protein SCLCIDRAFT_329404 [Scleroderma citrinum Foug A]
MYVLVERHHLLCKPCPTLPRARQPVGYPSATALFNAHTTTRPRPLDDAVGNTYAHLLICVDSSSVFRNKNYYYDSLSYGVHHCDYCGGPSQRLWQTLHGTHQL